MNHISSPLNDNISKVEFINKMGSDLTVVNAARVSMDKQHDEFDTEKDEKLIRFLAQNKHITPFFHPQIQFRIKMPFFVAREWYRHEIGFARNEVSRRYVKTEPELYLPETFRMSAKGIKQGSDQNEISLENLGLENPEEFSEKCVEWYNKAIGNGVAPEWARMYLPQNMYTEFVETGSLAAYARLVGLRNSPDSQKEIRLYAQAVDEQMRSLFPVSWKYLVNE